MTHTGCLNGTVEAPAGINDPFPVPSASLSLQGQRTQALQREGQTGGPQTWREESLQLQEDEKMTRQSLDAFSCMYSNGCYGDALKVSVFIKCPELRSSTSCYTLRFEWMLVIN